MIGQISHLRLVAATLVIGAALIYSSTPAAAGLKSSQGNFSASADRICVTAAKATSAIRPPRRLVSREAVSYFTTVLRIGIAERRRLAGLRPPTAERPELTRMLLLLEQSGHEVEEIVAAERARNRAHIVSAENAAEKLSTQIVQLERQLGMRQCVALSRR